MIEVNEETLRDFLSLVMSDMGCFECPWSDECDELDLEDMHDEDCVNLAIKCLQEKAIANAAGRPRNVRWQPPKKNS